MIDKTKLKKNLIILLIVISIGIGIYTIVSTLARYTSSLEKEDTLGIAFWFTGSEYKEDIMMVEDVYPREEVYEYPLSVTNSNGTRVAETDLEYTITIKATTNLPLNYNLYKKVNSIDPEIDESSYYTDENENVYRKLSTTRVSSSSLSSNYNTLATDTNGTYYKEYVYFLGYDQNKFIMEHETATTDNFIILVDFPIQYKNVFNYQDLVEYVKVKVDAKQIIN